MRVLSPKRVLRRKRVLRAKPVLRRKTFTRRGRWALLAAPALLLAGCWSPDLTGQFGGQPHEITFNKVVRDSLNKGALNAAGTNVDNGNPDATVWCYWEYRADSSIAPNQQYSWPQWWVKSSDLVSAGDCGFLVDNAQVIQVETEPWEHDVVLGFNRPQVIFAVSTFGGLDLSDKTPFDCTTPSGYAYVYWQPQGEKWLPDGDCTRHVEQDQAA